MSVYTRLNVLVCLFLAALFVAPVHAKKPTKKTKQRAKQQKRRYVPTTSRIFSLRHVDGRAISHLLRSFIPMGEQGRTKLTHISLSNSMIVQTTPKVMAIVEKALKQIDVPQRHFHVRLFFVQPSAQPAKGPQANTELRAAAKAIFPSTRSVVLLESMYLRAVNHQMISAKLGTFQRVSDPRVRLAVHQGPSATDPIVAVVKIQKFQPFSAASSHGTNTQFVTGTHLASRLQVQAGVPVVLGHVPLSRSGKQDTKALLVLRVDLVKAAKQATAKPAPQTKTKKRVGRLKREQIQGVIRAGSRGLRYCYEKELSKNPKLKGRVVVSFVIQPSGNTTSVSIRTTSMKNAAVESCLLRQVKRMVFPKPAGGGIVRVNYPLVFRTN